MSLRASLIQRLIPTRHASWKAFADRMGGEFRANRFWRSDEVVSRLGDWTVHLDTVMLDPESGVPKPGTSWSTRRGTQVWANFTSIDGFRFASRDQQWLHRNPFRLEWDIDPGRLVDAVRGRLGAEDVQVGVPEFDDRFTVKTNDPDKLKVVLDASIVDQVLRRGDLAEIRIAAPEPGDGFVAQPATLIIWERQFLVDPEQLLDLHELIVGLLDRLARLGSAAPASEVA
ncbi:MAG: hypothetical protein ACRDXD_08325 [Acidimicrobiia bacterium]